MRTSKGDEMSVCETGMLFEKSTESDFEVTGGLIK